MDLSYILNSPDVERIASSLETIATDASTAITGKVDKQQGSAAAGKALVVGSDGLVTLGDVGLSEAAKEALLACFRGVAWVGTDGQDLYDALALALTGRAITSLQVAFAPGSHVVYEGDTMSSLRPYLTVTVTRSSGTPEVITNYTLDGSLVTGTQTVAVRYGGLSSTFSVTVVSSGKTFTHNWDFTRVDGLVDIVSERNAVTGLTTSEFTGKAEEPPALTREGVIFDGAGQYLYLGHIALPGYTVEMDIPSFEFNGLTNSHIRLLCGSRAVSDTTGNSYDKFGHLMFRYNATAANCGWASYGFINSNQSSTPYTEDMSWETSAQLNKWSMYGGDMTGSTDTTRNMFSGKTVKIVFNSDGKTKSVYSNGTLLRSMSDVYFNADWANNIFIGGFSFGQDTGGNQCYDMTISAVRVYANS